ncbi:hypothetical protein PF010_g11022 [Phytophthora fragariae]|nr:hypothetical protein PF003_g30222 [Phytophthora fragariae]KAE8939764.1 hypothetical protein PF009_g10406 [Phytophthora fragariae]KAE9110847.1 hypothetical protein PF010_g11022 [Phytophthora fragariae]
MMQIQSSSAPLPAGVGAAMGDQTSHVQFWNQVSGGHVAQVTPLPGGGWSQTAPTLQPSQYVGSAGLVLGYGNGAPVPTPTASQYGAVVPQTPATTTTTMSPQTTRIRTAIPSYQNCTIGTPPRGGWGRSELSVLPTSELGAGACPEPSLVRP